MSRTTPKEWRKLFLYQVYVRSHTKEGTFEAFNQDLDRIAALGVDVVYFLPIHPIGQLRKKGGLGCPYSIADYRGINPEYGTMADFERTVQEIHDRGMKVMIDVVYNHTSHDSVLLKEHPEYFMQDEQGNLTSKEPDWSDIQDLDYDRDYGLWTELIDTLIFWQHKGVDGFRFDVASFLPIDFLIQARDAMMAVDPEVILLSESVHGHYLRHMRNRGFEVLSESEIYQVFDMAYDYDTHTYFEGYLQGRVPLKRYLEEILRQEEIYPGNYIKMRNLENHDFGRFAPMVNNDPHKIDNWTAFVFFLKGSTMIYGGQEFSATEKPSLFDKEDVQWDGRDLSALITKMADIQQMDALTYGAMDFHMQDKDVIVASYRYGDAMVLGVFNVGNETGSIRVPLADGSHLDLVSGTKVDVVDGSLTLSSNPVVLVL